MHGIKITISADEPAMLVGGGFESSNAYNLAVALVASLLYQVVGKNVTVDEIFSLLRRAAPNEFRDRTGLQGALAALHAGISRHYFLGGVRDSLGHIRNPHAVFSTSLADDSASAWLNDRMMALMPGIKLKNGQRVDDRQDEWTGRMMMDLIEKYRDEKSIEAAHKMKTLVNQAKTAIVLQDVDLLIESVREYAEIRYGFQKRWYELAGDEKHPLHEVLKQNEFLKSRGPRNPDLYTGGYASLFDLAKKHHVAASPLGKGGFGANWMLVGEPDNLRAFVAESNLPQLTDEMSDAALKDRSGKELSLKGWLKVGLSATGVEISEELISFGHISRPQPAVFNQRSGIVETAETLTRDIDPARQVWQNLKQDLQSMRPNIEIEEGTQLGRLYNILRRSLMSISTKIHNGNIDPYVHINVLKEKLLSPDKRFHPISREARVGVFPTAGNPLNWGHLVVALVAMDQLNLDTVVFLTHGEIDYKELPEEGRVSAAARHEMVKRVLEVFSPLFRYTDVAIGNNLRAQDNVHGLFALNQGQEMKIIYTSGSETEERLRGMAALHRDALQKHQFGLNDKHSYEWAIADRGEVAGRLNAELMDQIRRDTGLDITIHLLKDPDIDLGFNSTDYRRGDSTQVPPAVHEYAVKNGLYGYPKPKVSASVVPEPRSELRLAPEAQSLDTSAQVTRHQTQDTPRRGGEKPASAQVTSPVTALSDAARSIQKMQFNLPQNKMVERLSELFDAKVAEVVGAARVGALSQHRVLVLEYTDEMGFAGIVNPLSRSELRIALFTQNEALYRRLEVIRESISDELRSRLIIRMDRAMILDEIERRLGLNPDEMIQIVTPVKGMRTEGLTGALLVAGAGVAETYSGTIVEMVEEGRQHVPQGRQVFITLDDIARALTVEMAGVKAQARSA